MQTKLTRYRRFWVKAGAAPQSKTILDEKKCHVYRSTTPKLYLIDGGSSAHDCVNLTSFLFWNASFFLLLLETP